MKHIPNLITSLNLLSGGIACVFILEGNFMLASFLVLLGIFFDFFDGLAARLLNVSSELGLQLDSLADLVTSGLVPSLGVFYLLQTLVPEAQNNQIEFYIPYLAFLILLGSAYRLAKFNIDDRQTSSFIGLPTPANALLILSLLITIVNQESFFVQNYLSTPVFLIVLSVVSTLLLNMEVPLFALKFKNLSFKDNWFRFLIVVLTIFWVVVFSYLGVALAIISYILLSLLVSRLDKTVNHGNQ